MSSGLIMKLLNFLADLKKNIKPQIVKNERAIYKYFNNNTFAVLIYNKCCQIVITVSMNISTVV